MDLRLLNLFSQTVSQTQQDANLKVRQLLCVFVAVTSEPLAFASPLLICMVIVFPSPETPSLSLCLSPEAYDDGTAINEPVTKTDAAKMAIILKLVFELIIL